MLNISKISKVRKTLNGQVNSIWITQLYNMVFTKKPKKTIKQRKKSRNTKKQAQTSVKIFLS